MWRIVLGDAGDDRMRDGVPRELTEGERHVLEVIREHYGPSNGPEGVDWIEGQGACLWVRNRSGAHVLFANLTTLAWMLQEGDIASDDELRREWLRIEDDASGR